jgi:hypothetical protein
LLSIVVVAWAVIGSAYGRLSNYSNLISIFSIVLKTMWFVTQARLLSTVF